MKKTKMFLAGALTLLVAGGAFAFNHARFGTGSTYCFTSAPIANEPCSANDPSVYTIVDFKVDPTGPVTAPCAAVGGTPYDGTQLTNCPVAAKFSPVAP